MLTVVSGYTANTNCMIIFTLVIKLMLSLLRGHLVSFNAFDLSDESDTQQVGEKGLLGPGNTFPFPSRSPECLPYWQRSSPNRCLQGPPLASHVLISSPLLSSLRSFYFSQWPCKDNCRGGSLDGQWSFAHRSATRGITSPGRYVGTGAHMQCWWCTCGLASAGVVSDEAYWGSLGLGSRARDELRLALHNP